MSTIVVVYDVGIRLFLSINGELLRLLFYARYHATKITTELAETPDKVVETATV